MSARTPTGKKTTSSAFGFTWELNSQCWLGVCARKLRHKDSLRDRKELPGL